MARYPAGGQLPPIHWDDRDSPNHLHLSLASSKKNYFGSGLSQFDDSPTALMSRAVSLDQDLHVASNSTQSQGGVTSWQEKHTRAVLQDHIQTVTIAIQKISKEIEVIEEHLHNREKASEHTNNSVKNLEIQQVGSIADLRQRVGRCDVSIAKLSGDSRRISESLAAFNKQTHEHNVHHAKVVGDLETKISRLETQLDKYTSEQHSKVHSIENESKHTVTLLETKTKNQFEELQRALDIMQIKGDSDRQLLERGLTTMTESSISKRDNKQELFERKMMERLEDVEKKLIQQEGTTHALSDMLQTMLDDRIKRLERRLQQEQEVFENEVKCKLEEMAEQNESGFKRVKDSMATMRIVLEGKQQLLADNLHKQLANVKKLVVLT